MPETITIEEKLWEQLERVLANQKALTELLTTSMARYDRLIEIVEAAEQRRNRT